MTVIFNDNGATAGAKKVNDGSDTYANTKQLFLSIFHVASGAEVNFKAFITSYNENFNSTYAPNDLFGRFDPIMTFQKTTRTFAVRWEVPAFTLEEAKANLARCNRLAQFMYPAYSRRNSATTLARPPLMRIKFANLIRNTAAGDSPFARDAGLLVAVGGLNITPDFASDGSGFFDPGSSTLYPKKIAIDLSSVTVLHEHQLGWGPELGFNTDELANYPFGKTEGVFETPSAQRATNEAVQEITTESPPEGLRENHPAVGDAVVISNDADELNTAAETIQVGDLTFDERGQEVLYTPDPGDGASVGDFFFADEPDYGGSTY